MLADNLSLFSSQVEDLKEIRGFDENDNFLLDQSIIQHSGSGVGMGGMGNFQDSFVEKEITRSLSESKR